MGWGGVVWGGRVVKLIDRVYQSPNFPHLEGSVCICRPLCDIPPQAYPSRVALGTNPFAMIKAVLKFNGFMLAGSLI